MNKNIIIYGFMASGKTTVGKIISESMNMPFLDTDKEIEKTYHQEICKIFEEQGENYFRKLESNIIHNIVAPPYKVISVGGGSVLYKENLEFLKKNGIMIMLDVPLEIIKERLANDNDSNPRPLARGNIDKLYEERFEIYLNNADIVINARTELKETCKSIKNILKFIH